MPVFYRGPRALITDRVIEIPHLARQSFVLTEITAVRGVRESAPTGAWQPVLGTAALGAGVAAVLLIPSASIILVSPICLALLAVAGVCLRPRRRSNYRLLADYGGMSVDLVRTADQVELKQIARALRRAQEYREDL
jgi:hypothetical protein